MAPRVRTPDGRLVRSVRRFVGLAVASVVVGVPAGIAVGLGYGPLAGVASGIILGWAAACIEFLVTVRHAVHGFDAEQTRDHATVEDPGRRTADLLCIVASIVSVLTVVGLIIAGRSAGGGIEIVIALTALVSIALSWTLIHVLFLLSYARLYYTEPVGGIDFNTADPPCYTDFAYLAFDLGMTYQVSDTAISTTELRRTVLRHTLLSYLFGAVVLASVINLVVSIG